MKSHQLITGAPALISADRLSLLSNQWLLFAIAEFELLLGVTMLLGNYTRAIWSVALVAFGIFAASAMYLALIGARSCGCFGVWPVSPWVTFFADCAALAGLSIARPVDAPSELRVPNAAKAFAVTVVAVVLGVLLVRNAPTTWSGTERLGDEAGAVILEPEAWIGKPFPLARFIDESREFATDEWKVLLYRHDCPACLQALERYDALVASSGGRGAVRIAAIEVPPYAPAPKAESQDNSRIGVRHFRLGTQHRWIFPTPIEIQLSSNIVMAVDAPAAQDGRRNGNLTIRSDSSRRTPVMTPRTMEVAKMPPVIEGETSILTHTFQVANPEVRPMKIMKIVKACACTNAALGSDLIQPKAVHPFTFHIDLAGRTGAFRTHSIIFHDLDREAPWQYQLEVMIFPKVLFEPPSIYLGRLSPGQAISKKVLVTRYARVAAPPVPRVDLEGGPSGASLELGTSVVEEVANTIFARKTQYDLSFCAPSKYGADGFRLALRDGDDESHPPYALRVNWSSEGSYVTDPKRIVANRCGDQPVRREVKLRRTDGKPFSIRAALSDNDAVHCEIAKPAAPDANHVVHVEIDPSHMGLFLSTQIQIATDDPGQPSVLIPVAATR